jgi:hypothetical protein
MQKQRKTKYQIVETEQISQILNKYPLEIIRLLQNTTQIAEDEILKQLQRQNRNTKLQKLKESRNTRFCRSLAPNPGRGAMPPANPRPTHRKVGSTKTVFGIKPRSIKLVLI